MKDIMLINAPFMRESSYSLLYHSNKYPNLSLVYLVGFLEARGVPVHVVDAKFFNLNLEQILKKIREIKPAIIGFTSMTTEIFDVEKVIAAIKEEFPGVLTVLGGVHASALPMETMERNPGIDVVGVGEGEEILLDLANEVPPSEIGSIYYREEGQIKKNPSRAAVHPDSFGTAAFHHWKGASYYLLSTYRGCPFNCSFCFRVLGHGVRKRSLDVIMRDIQFIVDQKVGMDICDATFGLDRKHTEALLNEIIERRIPVTWGASTRVDMVDEAFLRLMKQAGCNTVSFGIESGSDRILKRTGKNISVEKIKQTVKAAQKLGLKTVGYYVLGHPDETREEVLRTRRMIWKLNTDEVAIGIMTPWPGTDVYGMAIKGEGGYTLLHRNYDLYDKHYGTALEFENFSVKWLEMVRSTSYLALYLFNFRFFGLIGFLWKMRRSVFKKVVSLVKGMFSSSRS